MSEPAKEEAAVELDPVKEEEVVAGPADPFIGGEVHILADPKTGRMSIKAPQNLVVALGILETAKVMIIDDMKAKSAAAQAAAIAPRPTIIPANGAQLKDLDARMRREGLLKGA